MTFWPKTDYSVQNVNYCKVPLPDTRVSGILSKVAFWQLLPLFDQFGHFWPLFDQFCHFRPKVLTESKGFDKKSQFLTLLSTFWPHFGQFYQSPLACDLIPSRKTHNFRENGHFGHFGEVIEKAYKNPICFDENAENHRFWHFFGPFIWNQNCDFWTPSSRPFCPDFVKNVKNEQTLIQGNLKSLNSSILTFLLGFWHFLAIFWHFLAIFWHFLATLRMLTEVLRVPGKVGTLGPDKSEIGQNGHF